MDNNMQQQENIQTQPVQPRMNEVGTPKEGRPQREVEPRKKTRWFWVLVAAVVFGGGVVVLIFVGDVFIREVTQEVVVEERGGQVPFSDQKKVPDPFLAPGSRLAPYFELENLKGEKIKISDFFGSPFDSAQGKPVVVTFWTTWNILSVDQLRILDEVSNEVGPEVQPQRDLEVESRRGVRPLFRVIAINSQEDRSIVSNFIERGGYDVEVLLDENGAVGEMYGIQTLPVTYFLDKEGNIADIYVGLLDAEVIVDKVGEMLSGE